MTVIDFRTRKERPTVSSEDTPEPVPSGILSADPEPQRFEGSDL